MFGHDVKGEQLFGGAEMVSARRAQVTARNPLILSGIVLAGARNVIASLWKVDDQATAALMKLFYQKLWAEKKPAIAALREAQLAIYRNPDLIGPLAGERGPAFQKTVKLIDGGRRAAPQKTADPRLWAAWLLSGTGR